MGVIFLFIDGVGLGKEDKKNPFTRQTFEGFSALAGEQRFSGQARSITDEHHLFRQVDATLGIEGLPQSGTGQTTLFSGENASEEIGKHFGPFPHSGIRHLLEEQSLFQKAQRAGKSCQFINAYPDIFFKKAKRRNRWSCTTLMTQNAGIPLNTAEQVKKGEAVTAELTQQAWREQLDLDVPEITPEAAADRLLKQSASFDLLLHEYYLTDKAGHSQQMEKATGFLATYDRFIQRLIREKPPDLTIVLSSDHGNVEDLSVKTHTRNKVPLSVHGPGARYFASADSIMDVTPGIIAMITDGTTR